MVSKEDLAGVDEAVHSVNSSATISHATQARINVKNILELGGMRLDKVRKNACVHPLFVGYDSDHSQLLTVDPDVLTRPAAHSPGVHAICLTAKKPLDLKKLQAWIEELVQQDAERFYRTKGLLWIQAENKADAPKCFLIQGVHADVYGSFVDPDTASSVKGTLATGAQTPLQDVVPSISQPGVRKRKEGSAAQPEAEDEGFSPAVPLAWVEAENHVSHLVFIGDSLSSEELDKGFQQCIAGGNE